MGKVVDPLGAEFAEFWAAYPHKVGRPAAREAYGFARRSASAAAILAGAKRYPEIKPEYQGWMLAKNWLKQERWTDEPDTIPAHRTKVRQGRWDDWTPPE